ncbi:MAG: NADH-quinone oxidoreductase subunit NuoH [Phycisphaerales bacterium]|nr:NADH-quinone oxidoreductase subunit NuoH [Phycisphaerales bacterium]
MILAQAAVAPSSGGWPQIIVNALVIGVMLHVILLSCAYLIMLERKLSAWMQDRVGPNRVGPAGLLQPIADGLKFLFKEDYNPSGVDKTLFNIAPGLIIIPAISAFVIIPWAGILDLSSLPFGLSETLGVTGLVVRISGADLNVGLIYLIAVASLGVYGVALGGWASNSKFSFFGGLRASAQMLSYEIPMGLALLCIVLASGSIDPYEIIAQQQRTAWNVLQQPIVAILFYTCMLAESNRAPFDLAEAESELVGGYHTEYSSMKFALFFLGEYFHMITGAAFFTLLFLGGYSIDPVAGLLPPGWDLPMQGSLLLIAVQFAVVFTKVILMVAFAMAIRWTIPRFRFDQLMRLAWEGMIPASVLCVAAAAVMVFLGRQDAMWISSLVCMALICILFPLMPRQANVNRRLPMRGSRFSPLIEEPGEDESLYDAP